MTQVEFFDWVQRRPSGDVHHYELIHGRIVMTPPAGYGHGRIEAVIVRYLDEHVSKNGLGVVLGSSAGYDLPSGDTLEPDVSFISKDRLAAAPPPDLEKFTRLVPDLVVEILSPSTASRDRGVKKEIYAANGVREYWLVDPKRQAVTVFHRRDDAWAPGVRAQNGVVPSIVLSDLRLAVAKIFRI